MLKALGIIALCSFGAGLLAAITQALTHIPTDRMWPITLAYLLLLIALNRRHFGTGSA